MKKLLFLLGIFLLSNSCEKGPFDLRNKYIGDYHFELHESGFKMGTGHYDTIYFFDGEICKHDEPNELKLVAPDHEVIMELFEDGSLIEEYRGYGEFVTTKSMKLRREFNFLSANAKLDYIGIKK